MASSKATSSALLKDNYNIKQLLNTEAESKAPVDSVQLDGLVALKIMKHCRETYPNHASGQLLGLDFKNVLEISTAFPFPKLHDDKRDEVNLSRYTQDMMRNLKEVNADSNTVGWYTSTYLGDFLTQNLVDTQYSYQKSLGGKCVVIVHDLSRSFMGNASFRAFRLSQNFMEVYQENKFTTESLQQNNLGFSNILEELPISFHNSYLVNAMMHEIQDDSDLLDTTVHSGPSASFAIADPTCTSFLSPNFNILELNLEPYIEKSLVQLIESVDEHVSEQNNYAYWQRTVARESARIQQVIQQKKAENISREAKGLALLPVETEEQLSQMSKFPQEPPRLDSLLINAQTSAYCQQLNQFTCPTIAKMYSAKSLQKDVN